MTEPVKCQWCGALPEVAEHHSDLHPDKVFTNCTCFNCDVMFRKTTREDVVITWNEFNTPTQEE